ncbi:unnamed protein product, partial [Closterium sp. Naga37s-1]
VLRVGGLPATTPVQTIITAFSKVSRVGHVGLSSGTFLLTFDSVRTATVAKRMMHRSLLAGHQITVEFSRQ